jgi:hypothetical protein
MPEVGSDEWIEAFAAAVEELEAGDVAVRVLHRIDGGPAWLVDAGPAGVRVRPAAADGAADLTFTWQRADADAVATGELAPLAAFQAGRLRIGGDLRRLPEVASLFARFPAVAVEAAG